jgi:hypothetical protein
MLAACQREWIVRWVSCDGPWLYKDTEARVGTEFSFRVKEETVYSIVVMDTIVPGRKPSWVTKTTSFVLEQ